MNRSYRQRYSRRLSTTDFIYDDLNKGSRENERTAERAADTSERKAIQLRIRELKDSGFPIEEAIKRLEAEFPNSEYKGFFKGWVENAYKNKSAQESMRTIMRADFDQER